MVHGSTRWVSRGPDERREYSCLQLLLELSWIGGGNVQIWKFCERNVDVKGYQRGTNLPKFFQLAVESVCVFAL